MQSYCLDSDKSLFFPSEKCWILESKAIMEWRISVLLTGIIGLIYNCFANYILFMQLEFYLHQC